MPQTLTDAREVPFSVYGERIAFKGLGDQEIHYGHICSYDEYYTNLGQTSSDKFCQPCNFVSGDIWSGSMITLGV